MGPPSSLLVAAVPTTGVEPAPRLRAPAPRAGVSAKIHHVGVVPAAGVEPARTMARVSETRVSALFHHAGEYSWIRNSLSVNDSSDRETVGCRYDCPARSRCGGPHEDATAARSTVPCWRTSRTLLQCLSQPARVSSDARLLSGSLAAVLLESTPLFGDSVRVGLCWRTYLENGTYRGPSIQFGPA